MNISNPEESVKISILIPVYNAPDRVKELFETIKNCDDLELIHEILVGDDCSDNLTKRTIHEFAECFDKCVHVARDKNLGYLRNVNDLYRKATGDLVILLNSDTLVPKGWLTRIRQCFLSDPNIALANPLSTNASFVAVLPRFGQTWRDLDAIMSENEPSYPTMPSGIGFCMVVRTSAVERNELLNSEYKNGYWEDTELHYYVTSLGRRSVCIDNLLVYHANGSSSFSMEHNLAEINDENRAIFMREHGAEYLAAVNKFSVSDPLWQFKEPGGIKVRNKIVDGLDVLFVLPGILRNVGGILVVTRLVELLTIKGYRAAIYSQGTVDWQYVDFLGSLCPFISRQDIREVVTTVDTVVATSFTSFKEAKELAGEFDASLAYFVQGPESAFLNGAGLEHVPADYKESDKVVCVSPYLSRYIKALSDVNPELIRVGPNHRIFYPRPREERDGLSIAVCLRGDALKGTGYALTNAMLAKSAGFNLHFFGQELPKGLEHLGTHHGNIDHRKLARLFSRCGYYLDCSLMEGLGLLPLEAAFCGAIPIMLRLNGLDYLLKDRENCLVLPSDFSNSDCFNQLYSESNGFQHANIRLKAIGLNMAVNEDVAVGDFIDKLVKSDIVYRSQRKPTILKVPPVVVVAIYDGREIAEILASSSWRITRPFRKLSCLLRGRQYADPVIPLDAAEGARVGREILNSASWFITYPLRRIGSVFRRRG